MSDLPDAALERARELATGKANWEPVTPRSAATVLLLRETDAGLQTYMMKRARTMAFAASAYVFPGGRLDPEDLDQGALLPDEAFDFPALAARLSTDEREARGLLVCAARELQEEAGVVVDPRSLVVIDHWVTPEWEKLRYDVRFFVAYLPDGEDPQPRGTEAVEARWLAPSEAIREADAGEILLMAPTRAALEHLLEHSQIANLIEAAHAREIVPRMDRLHVHEDGSTSFAIVHDRTGEILTSNRPAPPPETSRPA
ncbi:MAG: NUDIX hydrolase [Actinomycetota bacterium]|nr:NUDIX hydrolase [Actinomycetota bacterium]